jgi:hypothetical protein
LISSFPNFIPQAQQQLFCLDLANSKITFKPNPAADSKILWTDSFPSQQLRWSVQIGKMDIYFTQEFSETEIWMEKEAVLTIDCSYIGFPEKEIALVMENLQKMGNI